MQKLLRKQENWFSFWIQVENPFWQLCNPPAAHGKDQNGHLQPLEFLDWEFLDPFLPKYFQGNTSTLHESHPKFTEWPRNFRKKALSNISSPQVAISGASVFVAAPVPNAVQSPHWKIAQQESLTCSCLMENSIISWSTTHTPDDFLTLFLRIFMQTSEIHAPSCLVVMFGSHVPMGTEM